MTIDKEIDKIHDEVLTDAIIVYGGCDDRNKAEQYAKNILKKARNKLKKE